MSSGRQFARVDWLGQNRVPHACLLNTDPGGYDNCGSGLHQCAGVVQMRVLQGLMSRRNIMMLIMDQTLEAGEDHTKRLTGNGDTLQSDEPLILEC